MDQYGHFFVSTWAAAEIMYLISQKYPQIEWIIVMRDIKRVANSIRRYIWKPRRMDKVDADFIAFTYINVYQFILKQVYRMKVKPYFLDFEDMVSGRKNNALFELFNIDATEKMVRDAQKHWLKKHNTVGEYTINQIDLGIVLFANDIRKNLMGVCRCL